MPTEVNCPKCQAKYRLADSMLGKTLKCKKCETAFRTPAAISGASPRTAGAKAAGANAARSKPAAARKSTAGPSANELAQFGLEGIRRAAGVWDDARPAQHGGLNNFANDPGFATGGELDPFADEASDSTASAENSELAEVISNPYASPAGNARAKGGGPARAKQPTGTAGDYGVARVGMTMIYFATMVVIGLMILFTITNLVASATGMTGESMRDSMGETGMMIIGFISLGGLVVYGLALLVLCFGQILCCFAPQANERLNAGLCIGCLVAAVVLPLIAGFALGVGGKLAGESGVTAGSATMAVLGIMVLLTILFCYGLVLASQYFFVNFYQKIGQNLRSKKVKGAAKTAMVTWLVAICLAVVTTIAIIVMANVSGSPEEASPTVLFLIQALVFANIFALIAVLGSMIGMVKAALERTARA